MKYIWPVENTDGPRVSHFDNEVTGHVFAIVQSSIDVARIIRTTGTIQDYQPYFINLKPYPILYHQRDKFVPPPRDTESLKIKY